MLTKAVQHSKNSNIVKFKITIQSNRFLFEYIFNVILYANILYSNLIWSKKHFSKIKKLILLFNKNALNRSKLTVKVFIMLQTIIFQVDADLLNFYSSKNYEINIYYNKNHYYYRIIAHN